MFLTSDIRGFVHSVPVRAIRLAITNWYDDRCGVARLELLDEEHDFVTHGTQLRTQQVQTPGHTRDHL